MTAPSPDGVYYVVEAKVLDHLANAYLDLDVVNIRPSIDMDRVPYTAATLDLRNVDEQTWRALDPRVTKTPVGGGDLMFRVRQYSADGVLQGTIPEVGGFGNDFAELHIRDADRDPTTGAATVTVGGGETMLDDKRRIAGTTVDTGAATVDALVTWSLNDVFGSYALSRDAIVAATAIPAGDRRRMFQGATHSELLQTELDAIGCRLYDYWGRGWRAGDREAPPTYPGVPLLTRLSTYSGRGAVTTEPVYSDWVTTRTNLWANPRAVAGGTAFASPSTGTGSYVTDMPGEITTARRWTSSGTSNTRIIPMSLGIATPDQGERAHVRMRVRITGGSVAVVRLAVRPNDIGSSTNSTQQDFGTLGPGEHTLELLLNTNAIAASASAGVVLTGAASAAGVTVDATEILIETITDGDYFDGSTADGELVQNIWAGLENGSYSWQQTRTQTGTIDVAAPSILPPDVDPIVLDGIRERLSRDTDWADGVLVKGDYTDSGGTRVTWYQASGAGANTRGRVVQLERPQPAGNIADQYVTRSRLRGQTLDVPARARFDVLPGQTLQLFYTGGVLASIIRGVEWDIEAGTMTIRCVTGTPVG